jgi:hypothetical protein
MKRFVISILGDSDDKFFFAGWDASDTIPTAGEMTYWRPKITDPETYEYDTASEAEIEVQLLIKCALAFSIGLPENFINDVIRLKVEEVKVGSYGY